MESRLAQVQALVQQRWDRAREKQRRNRALAQRKQALVDELTALISSTRSVNEAEASELEAQILKQEREVEESRKRVAIKRKTVARRRSRRLVLDTQIAQLENIIASERKKNTRFFGQVAADKRALEEVARQQRKQERAKLEEKRRMLLQDRGRIQDEVVAAQSKVRENGNALRALDEERRKLERELNDATQLNASLKKRVQLEREQQRKSTDATRKQAAHDLEVRANNILKELDELCA